MAEAVPRVETSAMFRGTRLHAVVAACLSARRHPSQEVDRLTDDDFAAVSACYKIGMDSIRAAEALGQIVLIEQAVNLTRLGIAHGTLDFAVVEPGEQFCATDWKFGDGPVQSPAHNRQLQAYAIGLVDDYGCGHGIVEVFQPSKGGDIPFATYSAEQLTRLAGEIRGIVERAKDPKAPLIPGDHCSMCPAAAGCPARTAIAESVIALRPVSPADVIRALDPENRVRYYDRLKLARSWLEAALESIDAAVVDRSLDVPGLSVAPGRNARVWSDESAARTMLVEMLGERATKLVSVAEAEKIAGKDRKKQFAKLVGTVPGKPRVAREGSKGAVGDDA